METIPKDVRFFIYTITLFLQTGRSKTGKEMDIMFQSAYRLYVKYNIEKISERPLGDEEIGKLIKMEGKP